jgi:hypothetical protein
LGCQCLGGLASSKLFFHLLSKVGSFQVLQQEERVMALRNAFKDLG